MIHRILIPLLLSIILPEIYLDMHFLRRHFRQHSWWRLVWWLPTVVMVGYTLILAGLHTFAPADVVWLKVYMALFAFTSGPKLFFAVFSLAGYMIKKIFHTTYNYGNVLGIFVAISVVVSYFYACVYGIRQFVVKRVELEFADLPPAFDGYRIVLFSDAHVGSFHGRNKRLLQRDLDSINAQKADMIVFTGDLENLQPSEIKPFVGELSRLSARDGVFSVLGNHDYSFYITADSVVKAANERETQRLERDCGWLLLQNEHRIIRRGADSLVIAGEGNYGGGIFPERCDLHASLSGLRPGAFVVMLQHTPKAWRSDILPHSNVQLTLSGHTHGGQMSLFGLRPNEIHGDPDFGLYEEGNRKLYVTGGIGALVPFRFNMPAEIIVFTLKQKR